MSTTPRSKAPIGATAADCGRLWVTLTQEYIPGLRLEIRPVTDRLESTYLVVEVVDDSIVSVDGRAQVNVWASKQFRNELYLISVDQLFGLLIEAHRKMNLYFSIGSPHAPALRDK